MFYVDYTFNVLPNGTIIFDKELTPKDLMVEQGDIFEVDITNGTVILRKRVADGH